jgi:hypothetical protein
MFKTVLEGLLNGFEFEFEVTELLSNLEACKTSLIDFFVHVLTQRKVSYPR